MFARSSPRTAQTCCGPVKERALKRRTEHYASDENYYNRIVNSCKALFDKEQVGAPLKLGCRESECVEEFSSEEPP
jgi:hypothetical protein